MADLLGDKNLHHIGPIYKNETAVVEALKEQALAARPETNVTTLDVTNTTTESIPTAVHTDPGEDGISSGGVAGIAIGGVVALVALSVLLVILYKRRLLPWMSKKADTVIFSFDTSFQNLIDCPSASNSLRGSERYSRSMRSSIPDSTRSAPNLSRDVPTRSSYSTFSSRRSASRSSTDPGSASRSHIDPRYSTPTYQPNPYSPDSDANDLYEQPTPRYQSVPPYLPNPYYFPQSRVVYKQYNPNYVPSNVFSAPRGGYTASNFQYRPSRHIDRQLMAYYNWASAINEELVEPVRPRVHHQPRIIGEEPRY